MTLEEVLPALKAGKKIRRANFMSQLVFVLRTRYDVGVACDHGSYLAFGKAYAQLWSDDLLANDWEVVE